MMINLTRSYEVKITQLEIPGKSLSILHILDQNAITLAKPVLPIPSHRKQPSEKQASVIITLCHHQLQKDITAPLGHKCS